VSKSNTSEYRNTINSESLQYDELCNYGYDDGKESLIPESAVKGVLDTIEDAVSTIVDKIEGIEGLSEIDDVKALLKELSDKLY